MATVFIQTNEGAAHDHAVRMGKTPVSGIATIVCYTGTPVTDIVDIKALTAETAGQECYRILEADIPQTDISAVSTLLEPELPEQLTGLHITALGYLLKNGVLWGYVPYRPDKGGLVKDTTFSWVMKLVCTSTDSPTLQIEYSSLDLRSIRTKLINNVTESLNINMLAEAVASVAIPIVTQQALALLEANIRNIDCAAIANVLKTASVEQGVLWLDCQNIPAPPPESSVSLESGLLTLTIAGDNSINSGVISLTDASDSSQTYAIDQNNLTILER